MVLVSRRPASRLGPANASQWSRGTEVQGYISYATGEEKMGRALEIRAGCCSFTRETEGHRAATAACQENRACPRQEPLPCSPSPSPVTSCILCLLPSSSTDARAGVAGVWPGNPVLGQSTLVPDSLAGKQLAGKQQLAAGALRAALGCSSGENARSVTLAYSQWYLFLPFFLLLFSFPTPKAWECSNCILTQFPKSL